MGPSAGSLAPGHLLDRFLGGLPGRDPRPAASGGGQETGETAHIERWNNTLRQRLGRFVRRTLSFSKSDLMHGYCIELYLHTYNRSRLSP